MLIGGVVYLISKYVVTMRLTLTDRYSMTELPIDSENIIDYNQYDGFSRLLLGDYPDKPLERAVEIDVLESIEEIDSKMYE